MNAAQEAERERAQAETALRDAVVSARLDQIAAAIVLADSVVSFTSVQGQRIAARGYIDARAAWRDAKEAVGR